MTQEEHDKDMIESIEMWLHEIEPKWVEKELDWLEELRTRLAEEPVSDCHDLEEEISTWIPAQIIGGDNEIWRDTKNVIIKWAGIVARHFAEWGAYHLRDTTKKVSEDLEEAADEYQSEAKKHILDGSPIGTAKDAFKAGAEWQKAKMMEGAVEGKVFMSFAPGHNQMVMADVDLPTNTKVKIIIVEEDGQ